MDLPFNNNLFFNEGEGEEEKNYEEFDPGTPKLMSNMFDFEIDDEDKNQEEQEQEQQKEEFGGFVYHEEIEKTKIRKTPLENVKIVESQIIQKRVMVKQTTEEKTKFLLKTARGRNYIDLDKNELLYKEPYSYTFFILGERAKKKRVSMRLVYADEENNLLDKNFIEITKKIESGIGVRIYFKFKVCSFKHKSRDFKFVVLINGRRVYVSKNFEILARKRKKVANKKTPDYQNYGNHPSIYQNYQQPPNYGIKNIPKGVLNIKTPNYVGYENYSIKKQKKIFRQPTIIMNGKIPLGFCYLNYKLK
jgi:hypothetical protein